MAKSIMPNASFLAAFEGFMSKANAMLKDYYEKKWPNGGPAPSLSYEQGLKYIRIVKDYGNQKMSFCFIDKSNGDVLKCEGWKKPAKHARGNIFSAENGLEGINAYGANYLS
jgi:hypothetical protein